MVAFRWVPDAFVESMDMAKYVQDGGRGSLFVHGSLDSLLPQTSMARTLWGTVCGLDFSRFDIAYRNDTKGRAAIDPRRLACLWMLALLRGVTSSVKLAALCRTDIEMRWLSGDACVKKSTLCAFRKNHLKSLADLSTQVLAALARCEMLPGKELAVDGSIIQAASSCHANCKRKQLKKRRDKLNRTIEDALAQPDADPNEIHELAKRKVPLERVLEEMGRLGLDQDHARITVTEPQASLKKMKTGQFAPAHNVQATTDLESGAVVVVDVVPQANDQGLLAGQLAKAQEELKRVNHKLAAEDGETGPIATASADGAYHDTKQLIVLDTQGIETFVPAGQGARKPPGVSDAFLAPQFEYDPQSNTMVCPKAKRMTPIGFNEGHTAQKYRDQASDCDACPFKSQCCPKTKQGRQVSRALYGSQMKTVADRVASERGQCHKKARSVVAEGAFGRMVELLHWRRCRTWGSDGARAEGLWRQITHNVMLLTAQWEPLVMPAFNLG